MSILKYTPYIYLIVAAFFIYDGIDKYNSAISNYWLSFLLTALAIFMFYFRRRFAKKFEERNRQPKP
jgi:positive regulator of sigma E activity